MTQAGEKKLSYVILLGPAFLLYASLIVFPVLACFGLSFTQWGGFGMPKFVGLEHYVTMFKDPIFLHGLRNNILVVGISIFGQIPIGFTLAYILYRRMVKGEAFFTAMIFLPITISAIVVAILWQQIFSPVGMYTALMRSITGNPRYILKIFEHKDFAMLPILFVILWMYTGMYLIIFLANLQKISPSIIEAAIIDGASEGQILVKIILPSMLTVLFTTIIFAITGSLTSFDLIFAMTAGGPAHYTEVIAMYMYFKTFRYYKYGFGAAVSMVIVALSLGLISILQAIFKKFETQYE
ncbi:MAG: sugar ABC transporter permease [bacterium]|nr:sugar ABC transporter permease [bacterium]